ncbi:hypothetical protein BGP_6350 [Beggiatoa sp. PS]|nr:hypothetical protein BGP_6350 [Beggiatoa sp. PS]
MPWDCIKEIGKNYHKTKRGPGSTRKIFARKMINTFNFSIERAANHPHCPSAKYFLEKLKKL